MKNKVLRIFGLLMALVLLPVLWSCGAAKLYGAGVSVDLNDQIVLYDDDNIRLDKIDFAIYQSTKTDKEMADLRSKDGVIPISSVAKVSFADIDILNVESTNPNNENGANYAVETYSARVSSTATHFTFQAVRFFKGYQNNAKTPVLLQAALKTKGDATEYSKRFGHSYSLDDFDLSVVYANGEVEAVRDGVEFILPKDSKKIQTHGGLLVSTFKYGNQTTSALSAIYGGTKPLIIFDFSMGFWDAIFVSPFAWVSGLFGFAGSLILLIILTTIFMRTITWPVYTNTNLFTAKMQEIQPQIERIRQKYAGRADERSKMQMNMEMQALYKKSGVNFFGCFGLQIIQLVVFSIMWQIVTRIALPGGTFSDRIADTKFFGIELMTGAGSWTWPHLLMVGLMTLTQIGYLLFTQRKPKWQRPKMPQPKIKTPGTPNPKVMQIVMMVVMVGMFTVFSFNSINTMSFYWIVGNIYSFGQINLQRFLEYKKHLKKEKEKALGGTYDV
jgi:YidC/Oxa1 family membrane protein insertase